MILGVIPIEMKFDVMRLRRGESIKTCCSIGDSPTERAKVFREAISTAKPGDHFIIGPGKFDFGHEQGNVILPDGVSFQGMGIGVTHLYSTVWSDSQGTAFVLQNTQISNMTIECDTYIKNEDGRTIGFDPMPNQTVGFKASVYRCRLIGNAWCVYNWNNLGNSLVLEECEIISGRHGVSAMGSGSGASQFFDIIRCKIDCDASRSNDVGATSNQSYGGVYGVVARGGIVRIIDTEIKLKGRASVGPSFTPRCIGVNDTFETGGSSWTKLEIFNLRCSVDPNGAPPSEAFDIKLEVQDVRQGLRLKGGWGSNADTNFKKNW